jgi:hypothetical protein
MIKQKLQSVFNHQAREETIKQKHFFIIDLLKPIIRYSAFL